MSNANGVRFHVQAVQRHGFKGVSRAGRFWPSGDPIEVLVLDQEDDPAEEKDKDGKSLRHSEVPRRLGKKSYEQVLADKRLRVINAGDPLATETEVIAHMRARFDEAWSGLKKTHEHELERLRDEHGYELTTANAQVASLTKELADLHEHAAKLEAENVALMAAAPAASGVTSTG